MPISENHFRNLIPIDEPFISSLESENLCLATYKIQDIIKITECYNTPEEIDSELTSHNIDSNTNKVKSLFSKYKDFEVGNITLKLEMPTPVNTNTHDCPLRREYDNGYQVIVNGKGDITFSYLKRCSQSNTLMPKQFTLYNMALQGLIFKQSESYYWKISINPADIYFQFIFLNEAYQNIQNCFIQFTDLQREKFEDVKYYGTKESERIEERINAYLTQN